jgi:hypothetical protein
MDAARTPVRTLRFFPCGGAEEVARSYLKVHVRDGWSRVCRGCRDYYPCLERRSAEALLGRPHKPPRGVALLAIPVVAGMVLIAAATVSLLD